MLDKRACIARAKTLIAEGSVESLRYAALELRLCMETITYQKLRASSSHLPPSVIDKWQPPQAVKALLEYEPNADKGFAIFAGVEKEYGKASEEMKFVGEHKTPGLTWLRKHYNKVGSYLHVPTKGENPKQVEMAAYLQDVVADLLEATAGTILGGWFGEVHRFECAVCKQPVVVSTHRLMTSGQFTCLSPSCGAEYFGKLDSAGKAEISLKVTKFDCAKCGTTIPFENRKLDIGVAFKCDSCGAVHTIINRQWVYQHDAEPGNVKTTD